MFLNKAILVGNLTRDPELASLPSGQKVCKFGLATNHVWRDKNGAKQESATFHNIIVWSKQGELCAQYLKKGQQVLVEGRIENRSWEDKTTGEKRYRSEVVADRVRFGAKSGSGGPGSSGPAAPAAESFGDAIEYPEEYINPDDIPF